MLAKRVAARFLTAEILDKPWLMGVRRGWLKLLDSKPNGWPAVHRTFAQLKDFVTNMGEQVFFARRGPYTGLQEMSEGKEVKKLLDALKAAVVDEQDKAKHWQQVMEKTGLPGFPAEDGERMLDLYQRDFSDAVNGKQLTATLDKALKILREDADRIKSQPAEHPFEDISAYKEFDLYGMKVVIDDSTVTPGQIKAYINYLDEAYQRMKQKGVAKAWYGTVFIQCEACGGSNHNTGGGVGGNYHIGKDTVQVFSRPSSFIVELMAHELGHRFWFKQMSQTQRAKFESLVRVHKRQAPGVSYSERTISDHKIQEAHRAIETSVSRVRELLKQFGQAKAKWWKEPIEKYRDNIASAGWDAQNDLLTAMHSAGAEVIVSPEAKAQFHIALEANGKLSEACRNLMWEIEEEVRSTPEPAKAPKNFDKYWWGIFEKVRPKWVEKTEQAISEAEAEATLYVDIAVKATNDLAQAKAEKTRKEWQDEWDQDPRQVLPVSSYGESNIDEAWAEVFAHYVMGQDMNRDQIESFKSVLKTATLVERYKTAKVETIDEAWVERLRKDFLTLVKNIPRINTYEDGEKLREGLKVYRTRFRKFFFDDFLNRFKDNGDTSFEGVRKVAWDFYTELSMPLGYPDEYNSKESLFNRYKSEVAAWDKRVRSKAQIFWKNLKETLEYRVDRKVDVTTPDRDRLVFEGFQVEMRAYDQSSDWQQNALYKMREALQQYRRKASKHLPWLIQKQLPLVFNFASKMNEGGLYEGDHISIAMSALSGEPPEWGAHMLAHEMGHHLFKGLSKGARVFWDEAIRQDYGPLDLEKLLDEWPSSIKYGSEFAEKWAFKDPILALQVDTLGQERSGGATYEERSDFVDALERGVRTLPVPRHPITGYANKNTEEAFCEAIGRLVGYGPATVHPQIREWLRITIPGMVKLASDRRLAVKYLSIGAYMDPKVSQVVARFKSAGRMEVGKWYKHKHVGETYFLAESEQKNGGWAGKKVVFDRKTPKAKKDSVRPGGLGSDQWAEIAVADVPQEIKAAV